MEYVDGETLKKKLESDADYFKDRHHTGKLLYQLLDAVAYLHSHQILHLDLKPDNILLTRINSDVKLADLGCCRTDTFIDTPGYTNSYAAPEQLSDGVVDARTDIYAIGKIIEQLPNRSVYNKVIARCTAENPADRYQTIAEVKSAVTRHSVRSWVILLSAIFVLLVALVVLLPRSDQHTVEKAIPDVRTPKVEAVPAEPDVDTKVAEPSVQPPVKSPRRSEIPSTVDSVALLRADIRSVVLPKFNQTIGALPDSVEVGGRAWYDASRAFEPMIPQLLQEVILSHQSVPMETVAKEFNDYVQSLLTLKMNKAQAAQTNTTHQ